MMIDPIRNILEEIYGCDEEIENLERFCDHDFDVLREATINAINTLTEREQYVLALRFVFGLTFREIGLDIQRTAERASKNFHKGIRKLKRYERKDLLDAILFDKTIDEIKEERRKKEEEEQRIYEEQRRRENEIYENRRNAERERKRKIIESMPDYITLEVSKEGYFLGVPTDKHFEVDDETYRLWLHHLIRKRRTHPAATRVDLREFLGL